MKSKLKPLNIIDRIVDKKDIIDRNHRMATYYRPWPPRESKSAVISLVIRLIN